MTMDIVRVLGLSGSLRKFSFNTGLLKAALQLMPERMEMEIFSLSSIPLYNGDLESSDMPESVIYFKKRIAIADALLLAIPEYNYSISGVFKNAIDWASRPIKDTPLNGKPFAMMGAGGALGTARAQYHFRQVAVYTNMLTFNKPELMVPKAIEKFDDKGNLVDEKVKNQIKNLLQELYGFVLEIREISR
jgi:chromate reductase, NAD(P)H dehydrogenase (quinone)